MTEATSLGEVFNIAVKANLGHDEVLKLISMISTYYGIEEQKAPVKKRGNSTDFRNIQFGGHLKDLVKDGPKTPEELLEPLRERAVRVDSDDKLAVKQIDKGFGKSKDTYRRYPGGKWGLLSYAPPKLVSKSV